MVYIDTSVLVAYYCPEPLSEKVERFLISYLFGGEFNPGNR